MRTEVKLDPAVERSVDIDAYPIRQSQKWAEGKRMPIQTGGQKIKSLFSAEIQARQQQRQ